MKIKPDEIKTSGFALIDVTKGRAKLAKHFEDRPQCGKCPEALRIPIVIHGYISGVNSRDDGTSIEFGVQVEKLEWPEKENSK